MDRKADFVMAAEITRRELLTGAGGAIVVSCTAVVPAGCKSIPGMEVVYLAGKGIGGAAGLVLNECDLSQETRDILVSVATAVMRVTPGPGEGLSETLIGAAKKHVDALVAEGKVKPLVGAVVIAAFAIVVYAYSLLEVKFPQARVVREIACSAVDGFMAGFLATFKPTRLEVIDYDVEAYRAIKSYAGVAVLRSCAAAMAQTEEK